MMARRNEPREGAFAVIVEGSMQEPILFELSGQGSSHENASRWLERLLKGGGYFRGCVVELRFSHGNRDVFRAFEDAQQPPAEGEVPF